jgi:drug/metabolite transporter (DMT)-like permease
VKRHHLAILALLATAGAWGATFALVKETLRSITPETFMFWRFTAAGLLLAAVAAMRRRLARPLLHPGVILGILVFSGYWMQTHGLMTISPSRSAFLTGLYVVLVPFFQWRTSGRPKSTAWIAAILALAGTTVLVGKVDLRTGIGDALTIACAFVFALHVVLSARWSTRENATALAAIQVLFVGLAAAPFISSVTWTTTLVATILFTAIVTTALAFAALMWGQAHVTATEAAVILSFEPVAAAITSIAFYGEPITPMFLAGAVLILAAMLLSQL